jgi:hypothetical protein
VQREAGAVRRQQARHLGQLDIDEVELLRVGEVLGQQPERRVRTGRERDHRVVLGKARKAQRQLLERQPGALALHLQVGCGGTHEQRVDQGRAQRRFAIDEHAQARCAALFQLDLVAAALDHDADARPGAARQPRRARRIDERREHRAGQHDRGERGVIHGPEETDYFLHRGRAQQCSTRNQPGLGQQLGRAPVPDLHN